MKNKRFNFGISFVTLLSCIAIASFCGCSPQTGVRSGQVFNAMTNEPIEGAVVLIDWNFSGVLGFGPLGGKSFETVTDKDGKYYIPNHAINKRNFMYGDLHEFLTLIYKDGYAAYIVDHRRVDSVDKPIGYPEDKQKYLEKNNIVKLYPWKEGESHYKHISAINDMTIFSGKGELLRKELEPEKKRADKDLLKDVESERKKAGLE